MCFGASTMLEAPTDRFRKLSDAYTWATYMCGITFDNQIKCWGNTSISSGALSVPNGDYMQMATGYNYSCAVGTDGIVDCWGHGAPMFADGFIAISASLFGESACGIKLDKTIECANSYRAESPFYNLTDVQSLSSGRFYTCALYGDKNIYCRGVESGHGDWDSVEQTTDKFIQVAAGYDFVCGIRVDNSVYCWAPNNAASVPTPPDTLYTQISAISGTVCGVQLDGKVSCWGYDQFTLPDEIKSSEK